MDKHNYNSFRQEGNQLIHTRLLNAPRELVWEVWTEPEHILKWWGPDGFSLTHESMQVRPGGVWKFVMHGFGQDFGNKIEYLEVIKPSKLAYKHGDTDDTLSFSVIVTFEDMPGNKTLLTMRSVFESEEVIEKLNREVNAIEGGKQTLNRLEAYLEDQLKKNKSEKQ